jgi:hypothetical protein
MESDIRLEEKTFYKQAIQNAIYDKQLEIS